MSTPADTDIYLVIRGGTSYQVTYETIMSTLEDTDLLLVNRGTSSYQITAADFKSGVVPPADPLVVNASLSTSTAVVGTAINVNVSISGGTTPYSNTYQWKSKNPSGTISDIGGATSVSYTPITGDVGNTLACQVTVDDDGSQSETVTTTFTQAVVEPNAGLVKASTRFSHNYHSNLNRTPSSVGNRKTWTYSCWMKRTDLGAATQRSLLLANYTSAGNTDNNYLQYGFTGEELQLAGYSTFFFKATPAFRDPAAWMHLVLSVDTTIAAPNEDNRIRLYVNGSEVTFSTRNNPSLSMDLAANAPGPHNIGTDGTIYQAVAGFVADIYMVDGQQLTPGDFAEEDATTGQWVPKEFTGTYGTNGFHLAMDPAETGTKWSDYCAGPEYNSSYSYERGFNNSLINPGCIASVGNSITWTPPTAIPVSSTGAMPLKFELYCRVENSGSTISVNGTDVTNQISDQQWGTITGISSISSIEWNCVASNICHGVLAIRIDGKILTDHTAIGYDSSGNENHYHENNLVAASDAVPVSAATDGLPFYNTTGDYGGTKDTGYRTDSNASYLVFAMPGDVLTDEHDHVNTGSSAHTLTVNNNVTTSTTKSKFYGTSLYFPSDSTLHNLTTAAHTDFDFPAGTDFTLEFWAYLTTPTNTDCTPLAKQASGNRPNWAFYQYQNSIGFYSSTDGSTYNNISFTISSNIVLNRWYHVALTRSGTTYKSYLDGVLTATGTGASNDLTDSQGIVVGRWANSNTRMHGYLQDIRIYKGVAKYTSDFIVPTRQTNGADIDLLADTPGAPYDNGANGGGNYCTLNPLDSLSCTVSKGNLETTSSGLSGIAGTMGVSSGKYYWEVTIIATSGTVYPNVGIYQADDPVTAQPGGKTGDYGYTHLGITNTPAAIYNGSLNGGWITYGTGFDTVGDVVGVLLDLDTGNGTLSFTVNGVSQGVGVGTGGVITDVLKGTAWKPGFRPSSGVTMAVNFGARSFKYAPPAGFKALNTYNLDAPLINDPSKHFDTTLYMGTGTTPQSITGLGFEPGFLWIKNKSWSGNEHKLYDSVRGVNKGLESSSTADEDSHAIMTDFTSDGFTVVELSGQSHTNNLGNSFVSWAWNAGAAANTTSVSVGDYNSSTYNQDETWSADVTSSNGFWSGQGATNAFDGTGSSVTGTNSGGTITFSPNLTIPANSIIEVRPSTQSGGYTVVVNGVSNTITGDNFHTVNYDGATTLTSITVASVGTASGDLKGVKINGKLLADDTVTINSPSIASEYKANTSAGFSIVEATISSAGTVGHGLNAKPSMVIRKRTDATSDWYVAFDAGSEEGYLLLNDTDAITSATQNLTSTTFDAAWLGNANETWINYCFSEVEGYSKFGSYEGNGDPDGPYIHLGFRPAVIMTKVTSGDTGHWWIYDSKRDTYNLADSILNANIPDAEYTSNGMDILSNGFKIRSSNGNTNGSGYTFIYCAFAESPFKYSNAR